jgi:Fe-S cluster biosynthesis and repair protein YggX
MGGEVGRRVLENVCVDCWAEWRETSARIINHYGLVLGNPDHRAQLRVAMLQFLALDDEDDGDGAAATTDN